jgi:DNA-binding FadR family transcriptional regulator
MAVAKRRSLVDDIFEDFSERIRTGKLAPGSRLPTEKDLSIELSVSRTVVREAMARLTVQGFTVPRQGAGVFVADGARYEAFQVTPQELGAIEDVLKLLEMRLAIETEMASLAAERRTDADLVELRRNLDAMSPEADGVDESVEADVGFHRAIARASGNQYFERFIDFLGVRLVPLRKVYLQGSEGARHRDYLRGIWREHEMIYEAIAKGDPAAARTAARRHMTLSLKRHAKRLP